MTETQTKPATASTTVWAGLFTVAAALAPLLLDRIGVRGDAEQQAVVEAASQMAAAIGGAVAVYGRVRATRRIG